MSRNYDNFADLITFSRASQSTVVDSDGTLKYAAHNLFTYSEDLSNWSSFNASTISSNTVVAPDGTLTADTLIEDGTSSNHHIKNNFTTEDGVTYTYSVYVKAQSSRNVTLYVYQGGSPFTTIARADLNFSNGTLQNTTGTTSVTALDNDWYFIEVSGNAIGTNTQFRIHLLDGFTVSYQGNGTSGVYVWGAHVYRSDKPMQNNPAQSDPNLATYVPTTDAAVYQPRIDFDAVTGDRKGLLIEEARTNELTYSEDFSESIWSLGNSVLTSSQSSPDGTLSATKLTDDASAGTGNVDVLEVGFTLDADTAYTWSCFAKADQSDFAVLLVNGLSTPSGSNRSFFDLSTGTVGTNDSDFTSSITDFGNGWYRIAVTFTPSGADLVGNLGIQLSNADGVANVTLDGSNSIFIYGAQLEEGSFPTSYIPTSGSTVTRSADVASIATSAFGFNEDEGTLFTEFVAVGSSGVTFPVITAINDGTNRIGHIADTSDDIRMYVYDGSAVVNSDLEQDVYTATTFNKLSLGYQENNTSGSSNGNTVVSDTSCTIPTGLSTLEIGSFAGTGFANGHYRKLQYFPRRLSDTELQEITS